MKYTRFDIKNRNKKGSRLFLIYFFIILIIALILGTIISKVLFSDKGDGEDLIKSPVKNEEVNKNEDKIEKFYLIQCGVFKVKSNADILQKKLIGLGNPIVVKQEDLYKVYYGIYTAEQSVQVCEQLKSNNIPTTRVAINIKYKDISTEQFCKIIDSLLQILNKISESQVEYVNTVELKKWTSALELLNDDMSSSQDVNQLKEFINKLPDELKKGSKERIEGINLIYEKISKFKE